MDDLNKKKSSSTSVIAVIVIALLLGFGAYKYSNKQETPPAPVEATQT